MEGCNEIEDHSCPLVVRDSTTSGQSARLGPAGQKTPHKSSSVDQIKQSLPLWAGATLFLHTRSYTRAKFKDESIL